MFQLDDKFLEDVGLNELPEVQKKPFLQYVYDKLELEVGTQAERRYERRTARRIRVHYRS